MKNEQKARNKHSRKYLTIEIMLNKFQYMSVMEYHIIIKDDDLASLTTSKVFTYIMRGKKKTYHLILERQKFNNTPEVFVVWWL